MRSEIALACLAMVGCTWETDLPSEVTDVHVDASRELLVTDDAVLAREELGFAHVTERLRLAPDGVREWLGSWSQRLTAEGHPERARVFDEKVTCAWLRAEPNNGCDATCDSCIARDLPLAASPFRPIAVANRTDLSVMPDRAADGGEGRIVFALADGAQLLPFTVIYEYAQRGSALEWTTKWHALGAVPADRYADALVALTETFVADGALAQIRTADALTGPLVLHQFEIANGAIVPTDVRNTPDWTRVPETDLRAFVDDNARAIADGTVVVPRAWWAASSSPRDAAPAYASDALVKQTCGGCHAQSASGFQIDPTKSGDARLSSFVASERTRRIEWMQLELFRGRGGAVEP